MHSENAGRLSQGNQCCGGLLVVLWGVGAIFLSDLGHELLGKARGVENEVEARKGDRH